MTHVLNAHYRTKRLLAALEPEGFALLEFLLKGVTLPLRQVLYEPGDPIRHVYFPHDTVVLMIAYGHGTSSGPRGLPSAR